MRWNAAQSVRNLWIEEARAQGGNINANVALLRIDGPVAATRLTLALETVLAAHPALMSRFEDRDGQLVQSLPRTPQPPDVTLHDVSGQDLRHAVLLARRLADRPLAPRGDRLCHASVLRLNPALHLVVLSVSMLVCDGYSMGLLHRDLLTVLSDADLPARGDAGPILRAAASPPAQAAADLAHWTERLRGHPCRVSWPIARLRKPEANPAAGSIERLALPDTTALDRIAARHDTTRFALSTAAVATVLHRMTGWHQIPLLLPFDGRNGDNRNVVGHMLRVAPTLVAIDPDQPFAAAISASNTALLESQRHSCADLARLAARPSAMIAQINAPLQPVTMKGLRITPLRLHNGTSKFDLSVLVPASGSMALEATFRETLFQREARRSLLAQIGALLSSPDAPTPIGRLGTPRTVGPAVVATPAGSPLPAPLPQAILDVAQHHGGAIALEEGSRQLTYAETVHAMMDEAMTLCRAGLRRAEPVLVAAERTTSAVLNLISVLAAGGVAVPVNPNWPPARIRHLCAPLGARFALGEAPWPKGLAAPKARAGTFEMPEILLDDPAYGIFTSGSTGRPKLVINTHRALARLAATGQELALQRNSRLGQFASLAVDAALWDLAAGLTQGATLVILKDDLRHDMVGLQEALARLRIDLVKLPPSVLDHFDTSGPFPSTCIVAGEVCPPDLVHRIGGLTRLINAYGPTEAGCWTSFGPLQQDNLGAVTTGRPLPGTTVEIRAPGAGPPMPIGAWGEVWIGGEALALGYYNDSARTARDFVTRSNTEGSPARWFRSGDRGRITFDGSIEITGRYDRMLKIRGQRIHPEEIETALRQVLPKGARVLVVAAPESGAGLVAFVEQAENGETGPIIAHLRATLPPALAYPAIQQIPDWPVTAGGKTNVQALLTCLAPPGSVVDTVQTYRLTYAPAGHLPLSAAGPVEWRLSGDARDWAGAMALSYSIDPKGGSCVYVVGLDALSSEATPEAFIASANALLSQAAHQATGSQTAQTEIWVMTNGLFDITEGDVLLPQAQVALAWVKAAAVELPEVSVKLNDIGAPSDTDWNVALGSLIGLPSGAVRATRGTRVRSRCLLPTALPYHASAPQGRVALMLGGGGIAEAMARDMAGQYETIVFASRRAAPVSDLAKDLPGTNSLWLACDITKPDALKHLFNTVTNRFGPLDRVGLFAGQSVGTSILTTSTEDLTRQYDLKARTIERLCPLLEKHAPEAALFCLSSYASFSGGFGSYGYAFGNLAAEAAAARADRKIQVFATGRWRDVGMTSGLIESDKFRPGFTQSLREGFTPAEGARALRRAAALGDGLFYLSANPLATREPNTVFLAEAQAAADILQPPVERPRSGPFAAPTSDLESWIAQRFSDVLGIFPVGRDDDFFALGGDSLQASDLAARLSTDFGQALGLATIYRAARVCDLAKELAQGAGAGDALETLAAAMLHLRDVPEGALAGEGDGA